jgi:hypothetical protein
MTPNSTQLVIAPEPIRKGFLGIGRKQSDSTVFKAGDGSRYMFIVTSNSYKDRENEWITTKALQRYVDESWPADDKCMTNNKHLYWHDDNIHIGDIVWCDLEGPFLIELSKERQGTFTHRGVEHPVSLLWDYFETADEPQGASHRFKHFSDDANDNTYEWIKKEETSTLPLIHAANSYTFSGVIDMSKKDDKLDAIIGVKGAGEKVRTVPQSIGQLLEAAGVMHKSLDDKSDAPAEVAAEKAAPPPPPAQTAPPAAEAAETPAAENSEAAQLVEIAMAVLIANNNQPAEAIKAALLAEFTAAIASDDAAPAEGGNQPPPAAKSFAQTNELGQVDPVVATKELTALTSELTDAQAVIVEAQKGIETTQKQTVDALKAFVPMLEALPTLVKSIDTLTGRLSAVEKKLGGRPRIASQDDATELDPISELAIESKAALQEVESVLGLKLKPASTNNN